jgi:hypothetical protein
MWRWRKRRANISQNVREQLELYGEDVLAHAIGAGALSDKGPELNKLLLIEKRKEILEWLRERRDGAEMHEHRVEIVEWAILIFVVLGVIVEGATLIWLLAH